MWFESLQISVSTVQVGNVITQKCSHEVLRWPGTKAVDRGWQHLLCGNGVTIKAPCSLTERSISFSPNPSSLTSEGLGETLWIISFHEITYLLINDHFTTCINYLLSKHSVKMGIEWFKQLGWGWIESDKTMAKWKVHMSCYLSEFLLWLWVLVRSWDLCLWVSLAYRWYTAGDFGLLWSSILWGWKVAGII